MALAQAKALDDYYEEHQKPVGPLHGLPISLKDQLRIKVRNSNFIQRGMVMAVSQRRFQGLETSMGYVAWLGKYETEDSILTALLRKAGAVFYVKTNVPQALMFGETVNNITGRTVNPRNKIWSCGGSSGGEGAIVGIQGASIGVGTDIGKALSSIVLHRCWLINYISMRKVDPSGFPPLSTSFMAFAQAMAVCRTARWPIVTRARSLFTVLLGQLRTPLQAS